MQYLQTHAHAIGYLLPLHKIKIFVIITIIKNSSYKLTSVIPNTLNVKDQ